MTRTGARPPAPWLTVVNSRDFMDYCGECGEPLKKGGKVQAIEGGYGYRCEQCGEKRSSGERGPGP